EKSLRIRVLADDRFAVEHQLRNAGDMLWSGGAWALTCTRPGRATSYGIPLDRPPVPEWDVLTLIVPRRWGGGHTSALVDPQLELRENGLLIKPTGKEA